MHALLTPIATVPSMPLASELGPCRVLRALRDLEPATAGDVGRAIGVPAKRALNALVRRERDGRAMRCGERLNERGRPTALWRLV